jgi:hypothetical protein
MLSVWLPDDLEYMERARAIQEGFEEAVELPDRPHVFVTTYVTPKEAAKGS